MNAILPSLAVSVLALASCTDEPSVLPFSIEAEHEGVRFHLEVVNEVFEQPRPRRSCTRGDACPVYEGQYRSTIETDRPFGPVENLQIEHAANLSIFGLISAVVPDDGTDLFRVDFVSGYPRGTDPVHYPSAEHRIWFEPKLPGLWDYYRGSFEFPGDYDLDSIPSVVVE